MMAIIPTKTARPRRSRSCRPACRNDLAARGVGQCVGSRLRAVRYAPDMGRLAILSVVIGAVAANAEPGGDFKPYRGARNLCSEHISGTKMHISWTSWATTDTRPPSSRSTNNPPVTRLEPGTRGSRHSTVADMDHHLSIFPASSNDDFPHCDRKPKPTESTVILMSQAIR